MSKGGVSQEPLQARANVLRARNNVPRTCKGRGRTPKATSSWSRTWCLYVPHALSESHGTDRRHNGSVASVNGRVASIMAPPHPQKAALHP
eukprot:2722532-Rhodomonas_salina.2